MILIQSPLFNTTSYNFSFFENYSLDEATAKKKNPKQNKSASVCEAAPLVEWKLQRK